MSKEEIIKYIEEHFYGGDDIIYIFQYVIKKLKEELEKEREKNKELEKIILQKRNN